MLISTVFLFDAVYYVASKEKYRIALSALFMVLTLLSKLHVLAALPLVLMYLYKWDGLRLLRSVCYAAACFIGTAVSIHFGRAFCEMMLFNEEQGAFTFAALRFVSVEVYAAAAFFVYS